MTLLSNLGHHRPGRPLHGLHRRPPAGASDQRAGSAARTAGEAFDRRVYAVQRAGAVGVGLVLLIFGLLGATGGVAFLSTEGESYLGMSSNGLLSALSLVVAVVLIGAALRGPRIASTVMICLGVLFLLSALVNMALLNTAFNLLAFRMSNVVFSVVVGLLLLVLGAYGRISGNLPADSPYAHPHEWVEVPPDLPSAQEDLATEAAMREAEIAVVQHYATEDQRRRVEAMAHAHSRDERRWVWRQFDA